MILLDQIANPAKPAPTPSPHAQPASSRQKKSDYWTGNLGNSFKERQSIQRAEEDKAAHGRSLVERKPRRVACPARDGTWASRLCGPRACSGRRENDGAGWKPANRTGQGPTFQRHRPEACEARRGQRPAPRSSGARADPLHGGRRLDLPKQSRCRRSSSPALARPASYLLQP